MNAIMIDIETLDTENTAVIASIGAVVFDFNAVVYEEFYKRVDVVSCTEKGMTISAETVEWWMKQTVEARKEIFVTTPRDPIQKALEDLKSFLSKWTNKETTIWAKSPSFDLAILRNAYKRLNLEFPIPFWMERDVRTLVNIFPYERADKVEVASHHALDDARIQVRACCTAYKRLQQIKE